MGNDKAVSVEGISKSFGVIHALDHLSLIVPKGSIFGLLGPNGAGKSTLIRAILGLVKTDAGKITVLGLDMPKRMREVHLRIGYMPQTTALYGELSVAENLDFFAAVFGVSDRKERKLKVETAAAAVALSDRLGTLVHELSGGMKQRISLACALVHKPELLLLDEPTVGIDPELRFQFWRHFRSLTAEGVTIIVSSHVMDEAERCDSLAMIRSGKVIATGNAGSLAEAAGTKTLEEAFLVFSAKTETEGGAK